MNHKFQSTLSTILSVTIPMAILALLVVKNLGWLSVPGVIGGISPVILGLSPVIQIGAAAVFFFLYKRQKNSEKKLAAEKVRVRNHR